MFSSVSSNCCLRASPAGSRSGGEEASPPPPRVTFAYSGYFSAASRNYIDVLVTGEASSFQSANPCLGANGGVRFLLERQSERSEDRPVAQSHWAHAERRAVGLPGAFKLRNDKLVERVV